MWHTMQGPVQSESEIVRSAFSAVLRPVYTERKCLRISMYEAFPSIIGVNGRRKRKSLGINGL